MGMLRSRLCSIRVRRGYLAARSSGSEVFDRVEGFDRGWCYLDKVMLDFSYVPAWRVWTLGCRPPRVVARQNDAESANSIEESRPRDAEQDRGPGQLPVGLLKSSEDVGAFRVS
jgi:hypothetical protein